MDKIIRILEAYRIKTEAIYRFITIVCGFLLLALMSANVFVRIFPIVSLHWFDEIVELLFAWLVFTGSAVLYSRKDHFMIDWLSRKTDGTGIGPAYKMVIDLICLLFVLIFMYYSLRLTVLARDWTAVFNLPRRVLYASMPVAGVFMVYTSLLDLLKTMMSYRQRES